MEELTSAAKAAAAAEVTKCPFKECATSKSKFVTEHLEVEQILLGNRTVLTTLLMPSQETTLFYYPLLQRGTV